MKGIQINGKKHSQGNQHQLGFLADPEPEDNKRHQGEIGHIADHLNGGIQNLFRQLICTCNQTKNKTDSPAYRKAA
ncbi:hypothetical protein D3C73_1516980 [compost metagenome]